MVCPSQLGIYSMHRLHTLNTIIDTMLCLLTGDYHDCPLERLYQQLTETDADTASHWTEVGNRSGRVRARIEGAEGDGNPVGRTTVATNLDHWELPETKPPTKEHTWAGPRHPAHI